MMMITMIMMIIASSVDRMTISHDDNGRND